MEIQVLKATEHYLVMTPEALLTVKRVSQASKERVLGALSGAAAGGPAGAIAGGALSGGRGLISLAGGGSVGLARSVPPLAEVKDVLSFQAAETPDELADHPAWPKVEGYRLVTVYPRRLLKSVAASIWTGLSLELQSAEPVTIGLGPLNVLRARKHLRALGYGPRPSTAKG